MSRIAFGNRRSSLLVALLFATLSYSCTPEVVAPQRPISVPSEAVWAGGLDGGAWIRCSYEPEENANWCTVWNDTNGEILSSSLHVLRETGKPVAEVGLLYQAFDGVAIWLKGNRALIPRAVFEGKTDGFPPPIESIP